MKTEVISVRVPVNVRDTFYKKCELYGSHSQVMRELVHAFVEDRLVIKPSKHTGLGRLYADFNEIGE